MAHIGVPKLSSDQIAMTDLLPETLCANTCTSTVFRVISPQSSKGRPYGLDACGSITSDDPTRPATWSMAQLHLQWVKTPTPFISVFNQYERALKWASNLEGKERAQLYIVVIDTYLVPQGQLWNAHQIAIALGFPNERIRFYEHENLFHGSIKRERILAVMPARALKYLCRCTWAYLSYHSRAGRQSDQIR